MQEDNKESPIVYAVVPYSAGRERLLPSVAE